MTSLNVQFSNVEVCTLELLWMFIYSQKSERAFNEFNIDSQRFWKLFEWKRKLDAQQQQPATHHAMIHTAQTMCAGFWKTSHLTAIQNTILLFFPSKMKTELLGWLVSSLVVGWSWWSWCGRKRAVQKSRTQPVLSLNLFRLPVGRVDVADAIWCHRVTQVHYFKQLEVIQNAVLTKV